MGSRSKWEDMTQQIKFLLSDDDKEDKKPSDAPLGDGMAAGASNAIKDYQEKQRKAIKDATGE